MDDAKRLQIYAKAEQILYDDAAAVWGYSVQNLYGLSNRVEWKARPDELVPYEEMKLV